MDNVTIEQDINKVLNDAVETATLSSDYATGDSISCLLESVINTMICSDNISDLWGPEWSLFLIMIAGRIRPEVNQDVVESGVKEVLIRMEGCSKTTPAMAISTVTRLSVTSISMALGGDRFMKQQYTDTTTKICRDLGIPSPIEVTCLYNSLGELACPHKAKRVYEMKPVGCEDISEDDLPTMLEMMCIKQAVDHSATHTKNLVNKTDQSIVHHQHKTLMDIATILFKELLPIIGNNLNDDTAKVIAGSIRKLDINVSREEIEVAITAIFYHTEISPHCPMLLAGEVAALLLK